MQEVLNFFLEPISSSIAEPASRIPFFCVIPHHSWTPDLLGSPHWPYTRLFAVLLETSRAYLTEPLWYWPFLVAWSLLSCYYFLWGVICFLNIAKLTWEAGNPWLMPRTVCQMLLSHLEGRNGITSLLRAGRDIWAQESTELTSFYLLSPVIHLLDAFPTSMVSSILS